MLTDAQIDHMVSRFLAWKLPADFNPDGGIIFAPIANAGSRHEYRHEPVSTNLLTYTQAKAMVLHMLEGTADTGHARADELREKAAAFESAAAGFYAETQTVTAKSFVGAFARARLLWCECTGEPLV